MNKLYIILNDQVKYIKIFCIFQVVTDTVTWIFSK